MSQLPAKPRIVPDTEKSMSSEFSGFSHGKVHANGTSGHKTETSNNSGISPYKTDEEESEHDQKEENDTTSKSSSTKRSKEITIVSHDYHDYGDLPESEHELPPDSNTDPNKKRNTGGVTIPFPERLHEMLCAHEHPDIVGWAPHGRCFSVRRPKEFESNIMPSYFKHTKITSFQRQLNLYGFKRITKGMDRGAYYHELFLKGRPKLTSRMRRQKVKGTGHKPLPNPDNEPNFYSMKSLDPNPPGNSSPIEKKHESPSSSISTEGGGGIPEQVEADHKEPIRMNRRQNVLPNRVMRDEWQQPANKSRNGVVPSKVISHVPETNNPGDNAAFSIKMGFPAPGDGVGLSQSQELMMLQQTVCVPMKETLEPSLNNLTMQMRRSSLNNNTTVEQKAASPGLPQPDVATSQDINANHSTCIEGSASDKVTAALFEPIPIEVRSTGSRRRSRRTSMRMGRRSSVRSTGTNSDPDNVILSFSSGSSRARHRRSSVTSMSNTNLRRSSLTSTSSMNRRGSVMSSISQGTFLKRLSIMSWDSFGSLDDLESDMRFEEMRGTTPVRPKDSDDMHIYSKKPFEDNQDWLDNESLDGSEEWIHDQVLRRRHSLENLEIDDLFDETASI